MAVGERRDPGGNEEAAGTELSPRDLRDLYYFMYLQRVCEDRIVKLYYQGKLHGSCYTGYGHEAIAVGATWALSEEDVVAPLHRDLGARLVRGLPPRLYFANFMGRATSPTGGREGNLHTGDLSRGILLHTDFIGANVPMAAGAALAFKLRGERRVSLALFGESTTCTGEFHEAANFAAVQRLPVVLVCWNNQYAYGTPLGAQMAIDQVAMRAAAYGIPGERVDGNDVLAVYRATKAAVDRARRGEGPTFIEAVTMRIRGHSEADDARYVPPELIEAWRKRDPIERFARYLAEQGALDERARRELEQRVEQEVDEAVAWAEASPYPDPATLLDGVYCEEVG